MKVVDIKVGEPGYGKVFEVYDIQYFEKENDTRFLVYDPHEKGGWFWNSAQYYKPFVEDVQNSSVCSV